VKIKILFVNSAPIITRGIGPAFADLGYQVKYINIDLDEPLGLTIDTFQPDLVFNDGGINRMEKLFPLLSDRKIPHVYWAIEDPSSYHLSIPYALKSSLVLTPCKESIAEYARWGIEAQEMLFACHPRFHYAAPADSRYAHELVFVGNYYDYHEDRRQGPNNILKPAGEGFKLKVYGNQWWLEPEVELKLAPEQYGGYLPNHLLPVVCTSSAIVLGVHSIADSDTMMSMRTFEILGCAGFYLTQWTRSIERLFKNHYHLVWSRSPEETRDLIKYYLTHPELRKKIAQQGQQEVYSKHTYHVRIRAIQESLTQIMRRNQVSPRVILSNSRSNTIIKLQKGLSVHN
jgi:spore maturation protein CgeB